MMRIFVVLFLLSNLVLFPVRFLLGAFLQAAGWEVPWCAIWPKLPNYTIKND